MKTNFVKSIHLLLFVLLLGATPLVTGCSNSVDSATATTEEDAADIVAASLGNSAATYGFSAQAADAATVANGEAITSSSGAKGNATLAETTVTKVDNTAPYTYNYTFKFTETITNDSLKSFVYKMNGVYDAPRMSSNDSANANWTVLSSNGNGPTGGTATVNGTYNRDGSQTSKVRNKNIFTSKIILTTTNLVVDKATKVILGGTASLTVTGNNTNGNSFSYAGSITFNGNGQATLQFANSRQFAIDISKAEANIKP